MMIPLHDRYWLLPRFRGERQVEQQIERRYQIARIMRDHPTSSSEATAFRQKLERLKEAA